MYTNYSLYSNYVQLTPHGSMMGYISVDAAGVLELKISNPVNIFVTFMSVIRMFACYELCTSQGSYDYKFDSF